MAEAVARGDQLFVAQMPARILEFEAAGIAQFHHRRRQEQDPAPLQVAKWAGAASHRRGGLVRPLTILSNP
jgi:hypothetical protein